MRSGSPPAGLPLSWGKNVRTIENGFLRLVYAHYQPGVAVGLGVSHLLMAPPAGFMTSPGPR